MPIPIIYQDEDIVVVHKPSGLLVHRSLIDKHETQFLVQQVRDQIGQYVYSVHRLDKPTSGLMVMALSSEVAKNLSLAFEQHRVEKHYLALVRGYIHEAISIDYPLREVLDKMTDKLDKENEAKPAVTHVEVLARMELPFPVSRYQSGRFSVVRLKPQSGRKHQLRRHMAHIRHPIIGDTTHGDGKQNRYAKEHMAISRLCLCANALRFEHPVTGKTLRFSTTLDDDLSNIKRLCQRYASYVDENQLFSYLK